MSDLPPVTNPGPADNPGPEKENPVSVSFLLDQLTTARRHMINLAADLSWLMGASQQTGVDLPQRMHDHLDDTVNFLAGLDR